MMRLDWWQSCGRPGDKWPAEGVAAVGLLATRLAGWLCSLTQADRWATFHIGRR